MSRDQRRYHREKALRETQRRLAWAWPDLVALDEPWVYVRANSNNPCRCACCSVMRAARKYHRARERVNARRELLW